MSWDLITNKRWFNILAGLKRNTPVSEIGYNEALSLVLSNSSDVNGDIKKLNTLQLNAIRHRVKNNGRITSSIFAVWSKIDDGGAKQWADERSMRKVDEKKVLLGVSEAQACKPKSSVKSLSSCRVASDVDSNNDAIKKFEKIADDRKQAKNTDLKARVRNKGRIVETMHPSKKSLKRRKRLEKNLEKWMRYYFKNAFYTEFGSSHKKGIKKFQRCIKRGGRFAFAMPRGGGKSTIGKAGILFAILTGERKFIAPILANLELSKAYENFCLIAFTRNERLMEDYSEVCCFFKALNGKPHNARFQLSEDCEPTGISISGQIVLPNVRDENGKLYPYAGSRIICKSVSSGILGLAETLPSGEIIRPDLVVPDDIQDEKTAASNTLSERMEKKVISSLMNLAGPTTQIACYMPCTVRTKGDVSSRFLDRKLHPEFQGETVPLFISFPDDFEKDKENQEGGERGLWRQYEEMWRDDQADGKGLRRCNAFYRKNRKLMDKGANVSWDKRIRKGEVSAIQTGMHLLFENGDNFYSEYQNDPIDITTEQFILTTDMVCNHMSDWKAYELPPGSDVFVGHIDINRSGLHWCVAGFQRDMTCHVPVYGKYPKRGDLWRENENEKVKQQAIFRGLKELCDELQNLPFMMNGKPVKLSTMLVDRGYESPIVHRFCNQARYSFNCLASWGRAASKYKVGSKVVGRPFENCHIVKYEHGKVLIHNSDVWRETAQRAFLTEAGNAGGTTLFRAKNRNYHKHFGDHITGEKLLNKYETDNGWRWEWVASSVGAHWDLLDAYVGCWAAAAYSGLSASGMGTMVKKKKKARVVIF